MNQITNHAGRIAVLAAVLITLVAMPVLQASTTTQAALPNPCRVELVPVTPITTVYVGDALSGGGMTVHLQSITLVSNSVYEAMLNATYNGVKYGPALIAPKGYWYVTPSGIGQLDVFVNQTRYVYPSNSFAQLQINQEKLICTL